MESIDIFAGIAGLSHGLQKAGFVPKLLVESSSVCCSTLRENHSILSSDSFGPEILEQNIELVDFRKYNGLIDLLSGGPPCQPFSLGGKRQGRHDTRDMFPQAVRAVKQIQPKAFVFENVKGLTNSQFVNYFEYIKLQLTHPEVGCRSNEKWMSHLSRLEKYQLRGIHDGLHYRVVARVVNSADYGIPQRRERVFLVGIRSDCNMDWCFPDGQYSKCALEISKANGEYWRKHLVPKSQRIKTRKNINLLEDDHKLPWLTVRDAITDLPPPTTSREAVSGISGHTIQPGARSYPGHTGSPLDEPAKTLKAGVHGVPGGENMLRFRNGKVRYFTVRECARLQTFPDAFKVEGPWTAAMKQLGNAVPVKLAEIIARDIGASLKSRT